MNQLEAQLVDFTRYAYSVDPRFGAMVAETITAKAQSAPGQGLGDASPAYNFGVPNTNGVTFDTSQLNTSPGIIDTLTNVLNQAASTITGVANTYYTTQAKLNQLQTTAKLQQAQNSQLVTAANNGITPGVILLGFGAVALVVLMGRK